MQKYLLIDDTDGGLDILSTVRASNIEAARQLFADQGHTVKQCMSEETFLQTIKSENDLINFENQQQ
jgi:hypothetical protein